MSLKILSEPAIIIAGFHWATNRAEELGQLILHINNYGYQKFELARDYKLLSVFDSPAGSKGFTMRLGDWIIWNGHQLVTKDNESIRRKYTISEHLTRYGDK